MLTSGFDAASEETDTDGAGAGADVTEPDGESAADDPCELAAELATELAAELATDDGAELSAELAAEGAFDALRAELSVLIARYPFESCAYEQAHCAPHAAPPAMRSPRESCTTGKTPGLWRAYTPPAP